MLYSQIYASERAENFEVFLTFAPPIRKMDRRPWPLGGWKLDPVLNRSAHEKLTLS